MVLNACPGIPHSTDPARKECTGSMRGDPDKGEVCCKCRVHLERIANKATTTAIRIDDHTVRNERNILENDEKLAEASKLHAQKLDKIERRRAMMEDSLTAALRTIQRCRKYRRKPTESLLSQLREDSKGSPKPAPVPSTPAPVRDARKTGVHTLSSVATPTTQSEEERRQLRAQAAEQREYRQALEEIDRLSVNREPMEEDNIADDVDVEKELAEILATNQANQ